MRRCLTCICPYIHTLEAKQQQRQHEALNSHVQRISSNFATQCCAANSRAAISSLVLQAAFRHFLRPHVSQQEYACWDKDVSVPDQLHTILHYLPYAQLNHNSTCITGLQLNLYHHRPSTRSLLPSIVANHHHHNAIVHTK